MAIRDSNVPSGFFVPAISGYHFEPKACLTQRRSGATEEKFYGFRRAVAPPREKSSFEIAEAMLE
jgi:hypothetical protein